MNNEVEGWQNRLNRKTLTWKLVMYQLAPLLHTEALFVDVQVVLVHERRQVADLPECAGLPA